MNKQNHIKFRAILLTTSFHALLVLLCYWVIIRQPKKTEEEIGTGGIVVNYGLDEEGSGNDMNSIDPLMQADKNHKKSEERITTPEEAASNHNATNNPSNLATQNIENAPSIPTQANNNSSSLNPGSPAKKRTINTEALFKARTNKGSSKGDGNTLKQGNQGSISGDPGAPNYGEGGSGNGTIKLDLDNRRFIITPRIQDDGQSQGRIVIAIRVDKSGTITYARAGDRGTTISDNQLWKKCENAVLGAKVNASDFAPEAQAGKVVFHFKVR